MPDRKPIAAMLLAAAVIPAAAIPSRPAETAIVSLVPGTDTTAFVQAHHLVGGRPCPQLALVICPLPVARRLQRHPAVRAIEADMPLTPCRARITPATARLGLGGVHATVPTVAPIGVLDGGIRKRAGLRVVYRLVRESDQRPGGHGTALAMLAAGPTGVTPGAPVWDLAAWADGELPLLSHVLLMIDRLLTLPRRPPVILCAWTVPAPQRALTDAIGRLTAAGSLVVAAAGNQGQAVTRVLPAALPEVLTVSAYDNTTGLARDDQGYADWSNWGSQVDLTAPGIALYTWLGSHWGSLDGTSGAAALVAGLAARIASSTGTPAQWQQRLIKGARPPLGRPDARHHEPMATFEPGPARSAGGTCPDGVD